MNDYEAFAARLRELISGDGRMTRIAELTRAYWLNGYTGSQFHLLADDEHPYEITERDILAVSMLGVNVPAPVTVWLLGDGAPAVTALLSEIPADANICDAGDLLQPGGEADKLWNLLAHGSWPTATHANGMGTTKISKLLAAKRRDLIPIFDSVVQKVLPHTPDHWIAFQRALADGELRLLLSIAAGTDAPEGAGLLRRVDAMLWMIGTKEPSW
jgi:hypothetical protein